MALVKEQIYHRVWSHGCMGLQMQKHILNETDLERRHRQLAAVPPFSHVCLLCSYSIKMNWLNTRWDIFDKQRSAPSFVLLFTTARVSPAALFFNIGSRGIRQNHNLHLYLFISPHSDLFVTEKVYAGSGFQRCFMICVKV